MDVQPSYGDAWSPAEIAKRVEEVGVKKARMGAANTLVLAVLAGAFISLGSTFFAVIVTGASTAWGLVRLGGALGFCLGLVLVVVAGAELFTGNNLLTMAWASRKVSTLELARNWTLVYAGNAAGAFATAGAVALAGTHELGGAAVGKTFVAIAVAKVSESFVQAFFRGVLCNALVCLAVWLCFGARSVTDKVMAVLLPISAFVTCGFEHSIANMFFIPLAMFVRADVAIDSSALSWHAFVWGNLAPVTLGNVVGGALLVGLIYWFVYLRPTRAG